MQSSIIRSVAHYVPERVVTNDYLATLMETSDEWIIERTGIKERRFVEEGTPTSAIAIKAAEQALERAQKSSKQIDLIIAATLSPDYYFPGIGVIIQRELEMKTVPALDIRAQCSGFVYGVATADAFIRSEQARCVLLVCAEVQSPALDLTTRGRDMAVLFGDGAGALVIEREDGDEMPQASNQARGVIDSLLGSDGSGAEVLSFFSPGTKTPGFHAPNEIGHPKRHPSMDGRAVFKNAVVKLSEVAGEIMKRNGVSPKEIKLLVPHQANLRINQAVADHLGLTPDQVFNNIERYGNTTAATIPICLSEAQELGRLKEGDLILTLAFGAGFTWGANLIRW